MSKYNIKVLSNRAQMLGSLLRSINKAGGWIGFFNIKRLKKMTVMELIDHLGQNNIRFIYTKPVLNGNKKIIITTDKNNDNITISSNDYNMHYEQKY